MRKELLGVLLCVLGWTTAARTCAPLSDVDEPVRISQEAAIIEREAAADHATATALVSLGRRLRGLRDRGLAEVPSTRLLIAAAGLMTSGIGARQACYSAVVSPLSDDESLVGAMRDLVDVTFI